MNRALPFSASSTSLFEFEDKIVDFVNQISDRLRAETAQFYSENIRTQVKH